MTFCLIQLSNLYLKKMTWVGKLFILQSRGAPNYFDRLIKFVDNPQNH